MTTEERKVYKALKQREYRRRKSVDIDSGQSTVVDKNVDNPPHGVDKRIWDYACLRAKRARRYAEKFPQFINNSDMVFQDPAWQYERELCYTKEGN